MGDTTIYGKHVSYDEMGTSASGKTQIFLVSNNHNGDCLGTIRWFGKWRQYCFFQEANIVMSSSCLSEISNILRTLMTEREKHNK